MEVQTADENDIKLTTKTERQPFPKMLLDIFGELKSKVADSPTVRPND